MIIWLLIIGHRYIAARLVTWVETWFYFFLKRVLNPIEFRWLKITQTDRYWRSLRLLRLDNLLVFLLARLSFAHIFLKILGWMCGLSLLLLCSEGCLRHNRMPLRFLLPIFLSLHDLNATSKRSNRILRISLLKSAARLLALQTFLNLGNFLIFLFLVQLDCLGAWSAQTSWAATVRRFRCRLINCLDYGVFFLIDHWVGSVRESDLLRLHHILNQGLPGDGCRERLHERGGVWLLGLRGRSLATTCFTS